MKKQIPPPVNRGILTIEILIALVIIMLAASYGYPRYTGYMQEIAWGVEASNMTAVGSAAKSYIRDHRDTLVSQVNRGTPVTVTASDLQRAGYLPAGFSLRNTAAQTYLIGIARDPKFTQKLVAFVLTTGGQAFSYKGLRYISQKVEGAGGYVWLDNIATGAFAGWEMNLASYGLSAARGRLATWLSSDVLGTDMQESDRLYRYAVNGRPDLNRMHTDIDMNSNNLNNARAVNGETGNFSNTVTAENDIKSRSGWLITGSGKGWLNETHGGGLYMDDSDWIKSVNGKGIYTTGKLRAGLLQLDTIVAAGSSCPVNGLAGRDSLGALLSCQSGRWQTAGSGGSISRAATNHLAFVSQESYSMITVAVASKFNPSDWGHTASAVFNVTVNGQKVGTITNTMNVQKGGSSGHYWGYQTSSVSHRMYQYKIQSGDRIQVNFVKGYLHHSSDIQASLTN
jgi:type II secretory pathway pseudopilin PulG